MTSIYRINVGNITQTKEFWILYYKIREERYRKA